MYASRGAITFPDKRFEVFNQPFVCFLGFKGSVAAHTPHSGLIDRFRMPWLFEGDSEENVVDVPIMSQYIPHKPRINITFSIGTENESLVCIQGVLNGQIDGFQADATIHYWDTLQNIPLRHSSRVIFN